MSEKMRQRRSTPRRKTAESKGGEGRLLALAAVWLLLVGAVLLKLVYVQVISAADYRALAESHQDNRRELAAQRGSIFDRNGQLVAVDLIHYSLAVRPRLVKDRFGLAHRLAGATGLPADDLLRKMPAGKAFVYLAHRLKPEQAEAVRSLDVATFVKTGNAVVLEKKFSRYYPYESAAAHVVGYCDFDNAAKAGLEMEYDRYLKGEPGYSIYLRDALGNQFPNLDVPAAEPRNGYHLETTIDMAMQGILDDELRRAIVGQQADNGSAVLLDPRSGEVLAMSNYPAFNPNQYNLYSIDSFRNRAIADSYEPGSTFKMVSLAICIDRLHLDLNAELVFCENGRYPLHDRVITDHEPYGYLTARQVFERSSNIGVVKLAERFDPNWFYRYSRDLGFGARTGIDLPAEARGILHRPADYSGTSVAYMSMGYEVAVTPLQIAAAYGAIANEGRLMQPYVVRRVVDDRGNTVHQNRPLEIRQVVPAEIADRIKDVLRGVVERGTGKNAGFGVFAIAGKTGTAQKLDRRTNSYSNNRHVASFVGFFPVEAPRYVMLVVINNPKKAYYGSQVAAPVFRKAGERLASLPGRDERPPLVESRQLAEMPLTDRNRLVMSLEGLEVKRAVDLIAAQGLEHHLVGNGKVVYRQDPAPFTDLPPDGRITLFTETRQVGGKQVMPRLIGLSLKEALQQVSEWQVPIEVDGSGVVVRQTPDAGRPLSENTRIVLICKPT